LSKPLPWWAKIRTHARGTANFGQEGHLIRIDDSAETKIADHDVCILAGVPEQQVFWLEVTVDDARLVKVSNCAEDDPDEICGIPGMEEVRLDMSEECAGHGLFIVVALCTDAVEKLATSAKIEAEVEIVGGLTANERLRNGRDMERTSEVPRSNRAM
jgi:hypothetical protein